MKLPIQVCSRYTAAELPPWTGKHTCLEGGTLVRLMQTRIPLTASPRAASGALLMPWLGTHMCQYSPSNAEMRSGSTSKGVTWQCHSVTCQNTDVS